MTSPIICTYILIAAEFWLHSLIIAIFKKFKGHTEISFLALGSGLADPVIGQSNGPEVTLGDSS